MEDCQLFNDWNGCSDSFKTRQFTTVCSHSVVLLQFVCLMTTAQIRWQLTYLKLKFCFQYIIKWSVWSLKEESEIEYGGAEAAQHKLSCLRLSEQARWCESTLLKTKDINGNWRQICSLVMCGGLMSDTKQCSTFYVAIIHAYRGNSILVS